MIEKDSCFELGVILKTHGVKGELLIKFNFEPDETVLNSMGSIFLDIEGGLVPFIILRLQMRSSKTAQLQLDDVNTQDKADQLVGCVVFTNDPDYNRNKQVDELGNSLSGYMVIDVKHGELGRIEKIVEMPEQQLLSLHYHNSELLIPLHKDFIRKVNNKKKSLEMMLPDGLIDLYTQKA
jgi:16S rRNA processing protein RimM